MAKRKAARASRTAKKAAPRKARKAAAPKARKAVKRAAGAKKKGQGPGAKAQGPRAKAQARKAQARKASRKAPVKLVKQRAVARKAGLRRAPTRGPKRVILKRLKNTAPKKAQPRAASQPVKRAAKAAKPIVRRAPSLDRARRVVLDDDVVLSPPSTLDMDRSASAARSGRRQLEERLEEHTETGPGLTAGDIDADWESAYSIGDEAPGGDNPTPDQDIVDDIGRALGNEYQDNEPLKGADKITQRDRHRWELDPGSKENFGDDEE